MNPLVVIDEKIMTAQALYDYFKPLYRKRKNSKYNQVYLLGDDSFLCDYLTFAINKANAKYPIFDKVTYLEGIPCTDYRMESLTVAEVPTAPLNRIADFPKSKSLIYFFVDCDDITQKKKTLENLTFILEYLKRNTSSKCIVSVLLPEYENFTGAPTALAEREFNFFLEKECKRTAEIEYYLELERMCRQYVREYHLDLSMLRFDNVFSPDCYHIHTFDFKLIIDSALKEKEICISDQDFQNVFSLSYVRDACINMFAASFSAKKGHIYNVAACELTVSDIKETLFQSQKECFSMTKKLSAQTQHSYRCLNCLKFRSLSIEDHFDLLTGVKHVFSYHTRFDYDITDNIAFYTGRIDQIQALEIEMLKEIDRICRENNIKYFLAGGTLLGAVRTGNVIPWDDDLDIGMLREDYDKFRKACKTQLSDKFSYSCPFNGSGSHYTTEKIRLESTYFSTTYSSRNVFPDGVFVDILIYDKTSNIKLFQKLHTTILAILYNCIIVRWYNKARPGVHYWLTKLLLPILRLIPWCVYHGLFEFFSKIYKRKRDAKWLIDTVGKKLKHGPLPITGLEDTVYIDFNGIKAPIPVDYTGYLNYAYGPDYMQLPNYGNRCCPHNFARIDLGKYIFDATGSLPFRDVSIDGELFESEIEK